MRNSYLRDIENDSQSGRGNYKPPPYYRGGWLVGPGGWLVVPICKIGFWSFLTIPHHVLMAYIAFLNHYFGEQVHCGSILQLKL